MVAAISFDSQFMSALMVAAISFDSRFMSALMVAAVSTVSLCQPWW